MQRCLGARTEWDGKASMMFAALAKTFVPLLIVLPGFFALLMRRSAWGCPIRRSVGGEKPASSRGVGADVRRLHSGAAILDFVDAQLGFGDDNARHTGCDREKSLNDAEELKLGRMITLAALAAGILCAPLTAQFRGIYVYVQQLLSFFQGPVFALLLMGILFRRITPRAGLWSLLLGLAFAALLGLAGLNMLYMAFWSFIASVALLFAISAFTRPKSASELENLTYTSVVKEALDV